MSAEHHPFARISFWRAPRLPVLLQTEAAECAIACLAMVASHWGHRIDLPAMRQRFPVSMRGVTMKAMVHMAGQLALHTRPVKLDPRALSKLRLPCILHWDLNHFVVLAEVGRGHAVIHDPAVGRRRMPLQELSPHFTGAALELWPGSDFRPAEESHRIRLAQLIGRVVGLKRGLLQLVLLGLALQVCALVAPFYLQWVVDEAVVAADRELVSVLAIGFMLLVALQTALGAVRSWATTTLATNLNYQWLGNAFAHLMRLPHEFFEKRHLGDIVSRFGSIQTMQRAITTQLVEGVIDGFLVVATLAVMVLYSGKLALLALATVAAYGLLRAGTFGLQRQANAEQIAQAAKQQTHFIESARNHQVVRLFNAAPLRRVGWLNLLTDQFNAELRLARLAVFSSSTQTLLFGVERVAAVWLAALAIVDAQLTVGMLFAYVSYKEQFVQRTAALIDKLVDLYMLRLHVQRVGEVAGAEVERHLSVPETDIRSLTPTIEFRNVCFRYSAHEPNVLHQLSLSVPAGQCVAITGASGCGKTTLVKLLLGLLEPTEGQILVGGRPISLMGKTTLREMVSTVMQDDHLLTGSIAENISFFDPAPEPEHIEACAKLAAVHAEIAAMPMGYHTLVGDIGTGLSGGQRQRILLARALYKRPAILVLDEATSQLDVGNEQVVGQAVAELCLTRVLVAHRMETIGMAERVVVLGRGAVERDEGKVAPGRGG